ncbi:MAG: ComF family protein [Acidobacteria bacterium]|nr:ComF family protein [Acidobacteriota bacterium]
MCPRCLDSLAAAQSEYACAACHIPLLNGAALNEDGLCLMCSTGASRFDGAYYFGFHEGELRLLIQLFKYRGMASLAGPLSRLLLRALPESGSYDAVVPVPLHWRRRFARGYNQSALLAGELARAMSVPMREALGRVRATPAQSGLTGAVRRRNLRGAFAVRRPADVVGMRLLLVDDVLTTGATLNACAKELKSAGARHITAVTLARADRRPFFRSIQEPATSPHYSYSKGAS